MGGWFFVTESMILLLQKLSDIIENAKTWFKCINASTFLRTDYPLDTCRGNDKYNNVMLIHVTSSMHIPLFATHKSPAVQNIAIVIKYI